MKEIKPWLFQDPVVTIAYLNFDQTQLNSRIWPKKIKWQPKGNSNEIWKTTNKIFMYLLASFIV